MNRFAIHPCKVLGICPYEGLIKDPYFITLTELEFVEVMESGISMESYCNVFGLVCPIHWFIGPSFDEGNADAEDFKRMFIELDDGFKEVVE